MLYINLGQGNIWLNSSAGSYSTYRHIYESFVVFPAGVDAARILGAEVCLWSEVSNEDTFENNIWMRASAFGAKVWSPTKLSQVELVRSLTKLSGSLESMGVQPSPFTTEYC